MPLDDVLAGRMTEGGIADGGTGDSVNGAGAGAGADVSGTGDGGPEAPIAAAGAAPLPGAAAADRRSAPHAAHVPDHPRAMVPHRRQRPGGATQTMIEAMGPRIAP